MNKKELLTSVVLPIALPIIALGVSKLISPKTLDEDAFCAMLIGGSAIGVGCVKNLKKRFKKSSIIESFWHENYRAVKLCAVSSIVIGGLVFGNELKIKSESEESLPLQEELGNNGTPNVENGFKTSPKTISFQIAE